MRVSLRSKPKTVTDRVEAAAEQVVEFARSVPERLDTSRKRALAVAGGAASAAAGFIFWRSRQDEGPSVHADPARTPWKATPPPPSPAATEPATPKPAAKKPVTSTKVAATNASGSRSK
jgi:hypothetical protein